MTASDVQRALKQLASADKAKASAWFFKTGKGQYGEGDEFLGVTVPEQRMAAKQFRDLPLSEIAKLLQSSIHEHRLTALLILVGQYRQAIRFKASGISRKPPKAAPGSTRRVEPRKIVDFYLAHRDRINNWDLVDSSAGYILGNWLLTHDRKILYQYATSKSLWDRRIAIVATQAFIRAGDFDDTLGLAEQLLNDREDLMHKATGWMLREVGNRDEAVLRRFLDQHAAAMPRTMLRYAIEKLSPALRTQYLKQPKTA